MRTPTSIKSFALLLAFSGFAHAAAAAPTPAEELEADFELFLIEHAAPAPAYSSGWITQPTPENEVVLPRLPESELAVYAEGLRNLRVRVPEARARMLLALIELERKHAAAALLEIQAARAVLPTSQPLLLAQLALIEGQARLQRGEYAAFFETAQSAARLWAAGTKSRKREASKQTSATPEPFFQIALARTEQQGYALVEREIANLRKKAAADPATRDELTRKIDEIRARAPAEFRRLRARLTLEHRKRNTPSVIHDTLVTKKLQRLTCPDPDPISPRMQTTWSVQAFFDHAFATNYRPNPRSLALSEPDIVKASLATSGWLGTLEGLTLEVPCLKEVREQVASATRQRISHEAAPSYLTRLSETLTGFERHARSSNPTVDDIRARILSELGARALAMGDERLAKTHFTAALGKRPTGSSKDFAERILLLSELAALSDAKERPHIELELQSVRRELHTQLDVLRKAVKERGFWGAVSGDGKGLQFGGTSLGRTVSKQFSAGAAIFQTEIERHEMLLDLGIARAYDRLEQTAAADRLRDSVVSAALTKGRPSTLLVRAVALSDLAERSTRAGRSDDAAAEYARAASTFLEVLESRELLQIEFVTAVSPFVVFERAIESSAARGDHALAFQIAARVRSLDDALIQKPAPGARTTSRKPLERAEIERRIAALEQQALAAAKAEKKIALAKAILVAQSQQLWMLGIASPLAAARARLDALWGHVPRRTLDELRDELDLFEEDYQHSSSRQIHQAREHAARAQASRAESTIRASSGQDLAAYRSRKAAQADIEIMRRAQLRRSALTYSKLESLDAVRKSLGSDQTLLQYYQGPTRTIALVINEQSVTTQVLPGAGARALDPLVQHARRGEPQALTELYRLLIAPLRTHLRTRSLLIAPDGATRAVPFAALEDSGKFLFQDYSIALVDHPSDTLATFARPHRVESALSITPPSIPGMAALDSAKEEVEAVATVLPRVTVTVDTNATEAGLVRSLPSVGLAHIAAHAELTADAPMFSRLLLGAGDTGDGALEAAEIAALDLARVELVVLSACDSATAFGSGRDGSLARAFLAAGAGAVVASLWPVNDAATAEFMKAFYGALATGADKAAALDQARQHLLKIPAFAHPSHWASFVLLGDRSGLSFGAHP